MNYNGLQDDLNGVGGEPGMPGAIVQLWADTDGNGTIDSQVDQTTTTDGLGCHPLGYYAFNDLVPGRTIKGLSTSSK